MKRKLLYLFVLAIFTVNLAYSQYVEDTLTINRTEDPPLIDGYNDWEWDTEEFYTITEWGEDSLDNPHAPESWDCTAQYKMLWDDEYIYFLGVIVDDFVADKASLADAGAETWETDSWEFYIAPTLSKLESMEEMTQIRWSYANKDVENGAEGVVNGWSSFEPWPGFAVDDFGFAARELTADGWVLEARFALAPFAAKVNGGVLTDGSLIGWQITVSDNDGEALRDWIGSWIPDTQWDQADTLGILKLGSKLTGTVDPSGLDDPQLEATFRIYPNPAVKELRISGDAKIEFVEVINATGSVVLRKSKVEDRMVVSDLHAGFYFVKVYSDGGLLETHKFIKE
ncbi:MAG: sugar-binding protein [Bacteroidota bacterium]